MATAISHIANGAVAAASGISVAERDKLEKAAKAFEAIFTRQLIGSMRSAGIGDDLTGSTSVDQFQEMADARTADHLAETGGLGIAQMLLGQLLPKHHASVDAPGAATPAAQGER